MKILFLFASAALLTALSEETPLWKQGSKVKAISVKNHTILIETEDPQPTYRGFETAQPPKIVLEIENAWVPAEVIEKAKETSVNGTVKNLRVAQFATEPKPIVRVVMDLKEKAPYKLMSQDGMILVDFPSPAATSLTLKKPEPTPPAATDQKPAAASTSGKKDLLKELPTTIIDLNLSETDLKAALGLLVAKLEFLTGEKINLIAGSDVAGVISVQLAQVPFNEAWQTVLSLKGLVATQIGTNIIKITSKSTYLSERQQAITFTKIFPLNYAKASEMKSNLDAIRELEGRKGSVLINNDINALIVTDTEEALNQMERLVKNLDVRPLAVAIEAKLIDLRLDKSLDYGIQWEYARSWDRSTPTDTDKINLGRRNPNEALPVGGITATTPVGIGASVRGTGVTLPQALLPITSGVTFGRVTNTSFLTATLSLAEARGNLKVLSNPRVVTLNNQVATIQVGSEIPVLETTISPGVGTTQSVSYKNIGIMLTVTPTVNPDRYIRVQVKPVVSQIGTTGGITGIAPGIDTRQAETTIITKDEETIVIGGLISERTDKTETKVPLLGDIPIIGWFFKRNSNNNIRNELLVFVTPKILD